MRDPETAVRRLTRVIWVLKACLITGVVLIILVAVLGWPVMAVTMTCWLLLTLAASAWAGQVLWQLGRRLTR